MNDDSRERYESSGRSAPDDRDRRESPAPEIHREREVIVTGGGSRSSGPATAVMVIFGLAALVVVAILTFTFLQRDGGSIVPDELDLNIEMPGGTGGSAETD